MLLLMVELITGAEMALDELVKATGRAAIESPNAGIREKAGRVTHWRDGQMVLRWTASALLTLEKRMRRIMGHQQLWMLEAKLQDQDEQQGTAKKVRSA